MRVLLVGGLGFIGKHVIRALAGSSSLAVFSDAEAALKNQAFANSHKVRVEVGEEEVLRHIYPKLPRYQSPSHHELRRIVNRLFEHPQP